MEGKLDVAYTSGVIAVREKYLLKDKIFRFCESTAEEVFRALLENGFGGGAELPFAAVVAGNVHSCIAAEAAHILKRNYCKVGVGAPYAFDNLSAGRCIVAALAPIAVIEANVI